MGLGDGMGWINIANNNNAMQNNEPIQEQHLHSLRFITHCSVVVLFFLSEYNLHLHNLIWCMIVHTILKSEE